MLDDLAATIADFRTTTGEFGPLSNMAPGFPIVVLNVRIATAEALYQACRYPNEPDVQRLILDQLSPMTAKMKSKKYHSRTRNDWNDVRVNVMRWCLRIKLSQNWSRFGAVLERTQDKPIVEESTKDDFWGAKPAEDGTLVGMNVLGRLLMELRQQYREVQSGKVDQLQYPDISHFLLFGRPLDKIPTRSDFHKEMQSSML
ncbi:NADAR family protein [Bradyrhizobium sp. BRP56]|uniref:NADAR family protein n=1 Tax=Bradyrhizobium sp. BRP56 TaxID=2793819 RepID=UPI001CD72692|nr:NADAR family protein [Bradyrhizobium sp. BRP56]MCA1402694.1 NADAR family protein [Bradyrhizobium sp. BRP56]